MMILNIQRMSTEDGPGLRTTVFFKGCPLSCAWCHNPESISFTPEQEWYSARCIGCGSCREVCRTGALIADERGIRFDRTRCKGCFACAEICPAGAIEVCGKRYTARELMKELIKDKPYFGESGGVTLSGGEVTAQSDEAAALLEMLKEEGVHTAADTCGLCSRSALDLLLPHTDLFLYDLKLSDAEAHKALCGASNERIKENFDYLCSAGAEIWVRTPIIPGATDSEENIAALARFIDGRASRWELCAFNNLCRDKYLRLDRRWDFSAAKLMTGEAMDKLVSVAASNGTEAVWTGAVR